MGMFKLKISIGDAQIELEGNENMVQTIFQDLREKGLGTLQPFSKADKTASSDSKRPMEDVAPGTYLTPDDINLSPTDELPTFENVVLQGSPKAELEWLLIYAFYCSNMGKIFFTRDDLHTKYDVSNRWTDAKRKNFAKNLKSLVSRKNISAVNANDFRMEPEGLARAKAILQGTSTSNGDKTKGKTTSNKKAPANYKLLALDLTEDNRQAFKIFYSEHNHTSHMDKAVLAAYWLKREKNIEAFTADHLFTMLRTIGEPTSFDLASSIKNAKNHKTYFTAGAESGSYSIHHIGEDHVKILKQTGSQS
jgi:hypothetical protein